MSGTTNRSLMETCRLTKKSQVQAALELGKRLVATQPQERAVIRFPEDVSNLLQGEMGLLDQEHMRVLLLNTRNQVLNKTSVGIIKIK